MSANSSWNWKSQHRSRTTLGRSTEGRAGARARRQGPRRAPTRAEAVCWVLPSPSPSVGCEGPGDRQRRHAAARTAARMPGNGQSGNVPGRMTSVVPHSGDTCRDAGPVAGQAGQRRSDRTALFSLDGSLVGGKETQMFRGIRHHALFSTS